MVVARRVLAGVLAALVAGTVMGAVARLMMRLATLATGREGDFSLEGTAGILLIFVVVTLPGAVLAALLKRRGRSALLVLGALLLCLPAAGVAGQDLGELDTLSWMQWVGVGLATGAVFAAILALPALTLRLLARPPERS